MFMELLLLGLGVQLTDINNRNERDEEMVRAAASTPLNQLSEVHEILSCLVKGVYACDKASERNKASQYWTSVGYETVKLDGLKTLKVDADYDAQLCRSDRIKVGDLQGEEEVHSQSDLFNSPLADLADLASVARLMLFRRRSEKRALDRVGGGSEEILLPKYVVAIRGTMIRSNRRTLLQNILNEEDIWADTKIVSETFHAASELYEPVMRLVSAIHRRYGSEVDHVWVAGHSLGAMIGLHATRKLALQHENHIVLPTHLFNQPNVHFDVVAKTVGKSVLKGLLKTFKAVTPGFIQNNVPDCSDLAESVTTFSRELTYKLVQRVSPDYVEQLQKESRTLVNRHYSPYLYGTRKIPFAASTFTTSWNVLRVLMISRERHYLQSCQGRLHSCKSCLLILNLLTWFLKDI